LKETHIIHVVSWYKKHCVNEVLLSTGGLDS